MEIPQSRMATASSQTSARDIRDTVNPPRGFDQSAMLTSYRVWHQLSSSVSLQKATHYSWSRTSWHYLWATYQLRPLCMVAFQRVGGSSGWLDLNSVQIIHFSNRAVKQTAVVNKFKNLNMMLPREGYVLSEIFVIVQWFSQTLQAHKLNMTKREKLARHPRTTWRIWACYVTLTSRIVWYNFYMVLVLVW